MQIPQLLKKMYVPEGPHVRFYKGAKIDLCKWDGSDFFVAECSIEVLVTKKVAEGLKRNKITNLKLTNMAEEEFDADMMDWVEERRRKMC